MQMRSRWRDGKKEIGMNKKQRKIAWWLVSIVSVASLIIGLDLASRYQDPLGIFFMIVIPAALILGFAFYNAKDKKDKTETK